MTVSLQRLGRFAFRHHRIVLVGWLIVIAVIVGLYGSIGSKLNNNFTIPDSQSQTALNVLSSKLPAASGTSAQIVFEAPKGSQITNAAYRASVEAALTNAKTAPQVAAVVDPYSAHAISPDGRTALAEVQYRVAMPDLDSNSLSALQAATRPAQTSGLTVHVGGSAYNNPEASTSPSGESTGVLVAFVILFITFASLLAAGMPLIMAFSGIAVSSLGLLLVSNLTAVSSSARSVTLMIGLAVGIDYSVFILSRYRSELVRGRKPEEAAGVAAAVAGSAVVFAGLTVLIALAGLSIVRIPFLTVIGLGASASVAMAVTVALTLLPAVCGLLGQRLAPKSGSRVARREGSGAAVSLGEHWARLVTRRPLVTVTAAVASLLVLAIPLLSLQLAMPDNSTAPPNSTQRLTYDTVSSEFGPGFNGPLTLLLQTGNGGNRTTAVDAVSAAVKQLPDVMAVAPPELAKDGVTAVLTVIPKSSPHDSRTQDLVNTIRSDEPSLLASTSAHVSITGPTAVDLDVSSRLSSSLLPFAGLVVGLALLLLLVKFRSVLIPIEAALGFVLSIGATLGAVVAAFQWGWLRTLFGINVTAPVLSFLPMVLIAVLFGLAMDYEVFMVSRIREAFVEMQDPTKSVIEGGRHATRIVTAAALVMFSVFASFVSSQDSTIKAIAFGLAFGVAVDAFIVRMTFVPATLALLGRRSWWLPRWLSRVLPNSEMVGGRIQVVKTELFPNPMPDNDYPGSEPSGAVPGARSGVHGSPRRVRHHPGVQWRLPLSRRIVRRARSGRPAARRQ